MATWEFTSEHSSSYDVDGLIGKLNDRSAEGWDIVTIIPTGGDVTAFFKRELPSDDDDAAASDKDKKEAAPVAGGLGSLAAGVGSSHDDKPASGDDKAADKPLSTVGASTHDGPDALVGDAPAASAATRTPDPVKEPSGWAVSPDVGSSSSPSTPSVSSPSVSSPSVSSPSASSPSVSSPSVTAPVATTPSVTTPAPGSPSAGSAPSPWSNSASSTATTPSSPSSPASSEPMAPIGGAATTPGGATPGAAGGGPTPSAPSPAPAPAAPTPAPAPVVTTPAGWYPDPSGRFEMRYWDGQQWTEYVSRAGQQYTDPPVA